MGKQDKPRTQKKSENAPSRPPAQATSSDNEDVCTTSSSTARPLFVQKHILALLEDLNRQTALAPLFSGVSAEGEWLLKLKTWKNHDAFKSSSCGWQETKDEGSGDNIRFDFRCRHHCRYMNDVDDKSVTQYNVDCSTKNILSIPTLKSDELPVALAGEVKISVSSTKGSGAVDLRQNQVWSANATITWSAHMNITVGADGLRVELVPAVIKPAFHNSEVKCVSATETELAAAKKTWAATFRQIQEEFPSKVDLGIVMSGLRKTLGEFWKGLHINANSFIDAKFAFTRNGTFSLDTHLKLVEVKVEDETASDDDHDEDGFEAFDERSGDGIRVRGFTNTTNSRLGDDFLPKYDSLFTTNRPKTKVQRRVYEEVETRTSPPSEHNCGSFSVNFGSGLGSDMGFNRAQSAHRMARTAKQSTAFHIRSHREAHFGGNFGSGIDSSFAFDF